MLVILALLVAAVAQSAQDDYVDLIIPNYTHAWYSGYLSVDNNTVHYVYLESQNNRDNDPLVLWIGGGPGCSGLYSMFYEIGPFRFLTPESPLLNTTKDAWNKRANLLFFEGPGPVGFSNGTTNNTDAKTVENLVYTLIDFFTRFPSLRKNDLYLAGHGYAGILVPRLGVAIDSRNQHPFFTKINFKGLLLGNPCTDALECYASGTYRHSLNHYKYLYNHAFMTDQQWMQLSAICTLNASSYECYQERQARDKHFNSTNTSLYHIYSRCYRSNTSSNIVNTNCDDEKGILTYLNDPSIQEALHVTPGKWSVCNNKVFEQYLSEGNGSIAHYTTLLQRKQYNIFVYSADLDSTIPTLSTLQWVSRLREDLDIPVRRTWREWWVPGAHPHEDQVGGMVWELEGLTVATVKGSGFAVGRDKSVALY